MDHPRVGRQHLAAAFGREELICVSQSSSRYLKGEPANKTGEHETRRGRGPSTLSHNVRARRAELCGRRAAKADCAHREATHSTGKEGSQVESSWSTSNRQKQAPERYCELELSRVTAFPALALCMQRPIQNGLSSGNCLETGESNRDLVTCARQIRDQVVRSLYAIVQTAASARARIHRDKAKIAVFPNFLARGVAYCLRPVAAVSTVWRRLLLLLPSEAFRVRKDIRGGSSLQPQGSAE